MHLLTQTLSLIIVHSKSLHKLLKGLVSHRATSSFLSSDNPFNRKIFYIFAKHRAQVLTLLWSRSIVSSAPLCQWIFILCEYKTWSLQRRIIPQWVKQCRWLRHHTTNNSQVVVVCWRDIFIVKVRCCRCCRMHSSHSFSLCSPVFLW